MVKITEERPWIRPHAEGSARTTPRNHHNWGMTRRAHHRGEPTSLLELEDLAQRTVALMENYVPKSENNYFKAMDLLRLQYNLNFLILCEKCCGPHIHDEILAPER